VTVKQSDDGSAPNLLPLRWAVIVGLSAAVAVMIGTAQGVAVGIVAGVFTAGTLHRFMK